MKNKEASRETRSPKRPLRLWITAAAIGVLLAGVVLFIRGGGVRLFAPTYDASQPTSEKFAKIARWIPPSAEFDVAVDVQKALANPELRERLSALVRGHDGVAAELVAALLERQSVVGMLLLVGTAGAPGAAPAVAVIAQGGFDERSLVPAVRAILSVGRAGLAAESIGGRTLYAESDARDPFGFVVLDGRHIAVGERAALISLFQDVPKERAPVTVPPEAVLFGHASFGERIRTLLPPGLMPMAGIEFASTDGGTLVARLAGGDAGQAKEAQMFLEGIRSLLLLQGEGNPALAQVLKGIAVGEEDGQVVISCRILPLLDLWTPHEMSLRGTK